MSMMGTSVKFTHCWTEKPLTKRSRTDFSISFKRLWDSMRGGQSLCSRRYALFEAYICSWRKIAISLIDLFFETPVPDLIAKNRVSGFSFFSINSHVTMFD